MSSYRGNATLDAFSLQTGCKNCDLLITLQCVIGALNDTSGKSTQRVLLENFGSVRIYKGF
jgi:hypothetical protein